MIVFHSPGSRLIRTPRVSSSTQTFSVHLPVRMNLLIRAQQAKSAGDTGPRAVHDLMMSDVDDSGLETLSERGELVDASEWSVFEIVGG